MKAPWAHRIGGVHETRRDNGRGPRPTVPRRGLKRRSLTLSLRMGSAAGPHPGAQGDGRDGRGMG